MQRLSPSDKPRWPCRGDNATEPLRKSPSYPTQEEALRRLRETRFHIAVRGCGVLGMLSAIAIIYSPWGYVGAGAAALGYFVTCVWIGYHTFKRPTYPPTAPFDDRNRYIRDRHDA